MTYKNEVLVVIKLINCTFFFFSPSFFSLCCPSCFLSHGTIFETTIHMFLSLEIYLFMCITHLDNFISPVKYIVSVSDILTDILLMYSCQILFDSLYIFMIYAVLHDFLCWTHFTTLFVSSVFLLLLPLPCYMCNPLNLFLRNLICSPLCMCPIPFVCLYPVSPQPVLPYASKPLCASLLSPLTCRSSRTKKGDIYRPERSNLSSKVRLFEPHHEKICLWGFSTR